MELTFKSGAGPPRAKAVTGHRTPKELTDSKTLLLQRRQRPQREKDKNSSESVAEVLRHHQAADAAVHDADADAAEVRMQNVGAMTGRIH